MREMNKNRLALMLLFAGLLASAAPGLTWGSAPTALGVPGLDIQFHDAHSRPEEVSTAIKLLALLTVLSIAPAILIVMTAFTRIVIVLSMLRQASGMQDTPPNAVLLSLALILTMFTMTPVLEQANVRALTPYMSGKIPEQTAVTEALRRRGVDVRTSQDDGTATVDDERLFARAAELGRVLFSQDQDFLRIAARWQQQGQHFPGVLFAPQRGVSLGGLANERAASDLL